MKSDLRSIPVTLAKIVLCLSFVVTTVWVVLLLLGLFSLLPCGYESFISFYGAVVFMSSGSIGAAAFILIMHIEDRQLADKDPDMKE